MLGKICPRYSVIQPHKTSTEMCDPPYPKGSGFHDPPISRITPLITTLCMDKLRRHSRENL